MASRFRRSRLAANAEADGICALLNGGTLDIYEGLQPASADAPLATQVRLARLTFSDPAFGVAIDGAATAKPIIDDPNAAASGNAQFFRASTSAGVSVYDGSVGAEGEGCDITIGPVDIEQGARVKVKVMVYMASKGAA